MGIKYLNRFLKENATPSIKLCNLMDLSGKKIAVDISIYMYRFSSDSTLIENMYLMLSIFRYYQIIPIFIFDGKPPEEKSDILLKRKEDKSGAEKEYITLKRKLELNKDMDEIDKQEIICNMDMLKKKFVTINKNDIKNVKQLINSYGATYYEASGEADELCALLTVKEKVWACLSEDMDMFVYGCPRVIRYLSLMSHTVVLYEMKGILNNLGISQKELREICVLSGTDYNLDVEEDSRHTLLNTLKYYKKYRKSKSEASFYDWLSEKYSYYIHDRELLEKIYEIFDINNKEYDNKKIEKIRLVNGPICKEEIHAILRKDGFIFPIRH
jgi:flap endonuclease-1